MYGFSIDLNFKCIDATFFNLHNSCVNRKPGKQIWNGFLASPLWQVFNHRITSHLQIKLKIHTPPCLYIIIFIVSITTNSTATFTFHHHSILVQWSGLSPYPWCCFLPFSFKYMEVVILITSKQEALQRIMVVICSKEAGFMMIHTLFMKPLSVPL